MLITVIIPIYKVEAYIERCVRSLMAQELDGVEYIFVDDCSPDNSMKVLQRILDEYPGQQHVRILHHSQNHGLPAARNTGLDAATGDYVFHCDSDDYLEPGALQAMYEAARKSDADIVYCDWILTYPQRERYMRCPAYETPEDALRGLLHGTMKYNVWNKLVKRKLYNEDLSIRFPEGHGMGEDMTMILLFARAKRVAYLPKGTYHYVRQNENAFTAMRSESSYADLLFNASRVIEGLHGKVSEEDLACFKLNVKFPFLISDQRSDYERWNEWFPEANQFINISQVSKRMRMLQVAAAKKWYLILKIYYYCLHRIVYGIVY